MNVYSSDRFCIAFQTAYYPEQSIDSNVFKLGNQLWKLPARHGKKPVVSGLFESSFIDFYEPYSPEEPLDPRKVRSVGYLPKASHGFVTAAEWFATHQHEGFEPSPTVLWSEFDSWDAFSQHMQSQRSNIVSDSRRRQRKLEKQVGPLTFVLDDRRPEVRQLGMQWKSLQYQRSGCADHFADVEHVRLFEALAEQNLLLVSSLNAGDQTIAVHLGILAEGRLYWWIPAYDPNYSQFSPGRLLLEMSLQESFHEGHTEFDFLIGGEPYKWHYATHTRLIKELGTVPLQLRALRAKHAAQESCKTLVRSSLAPFPGVLQSLKTFKAKVRQKLEPAPSAPVQPVVKLTSVREQG